ncbi:GNAT family N-acetyltransferase [Enterococcus faecalis]
MVFKIERMEQKTAVQIADEWKYPGVYAFYDMTADPEDYEELIHPDQRGDHYFQVSCNEELFGFFCVFQENHSETIEFGMGIKPEHTGQGLGQKYLEAVLIYLIENYCFTSIRLAVAEFNQRAITPL